MHAAQQAVAADVVAAGTSCKDATPARRAPTSAATANRSHQHSAGVWREMRQVQCRRSIPASSRCDLTVDELMRKALMLNAADRASMAHELLSSLESLSEAEVEQLWVEKALRRSAEIDAGLVETIPADQVIAEARARLK